MIDENRTCEFCKYEERSMMEYPCVNCVNNARDHFERDTGGWIPCSERLPEEYGNYLVTSDEDVDIGTFNPDTAKWSGCDAEGFYWVYDIIAWMPLPEPYKEDSNG